MNDIEMLEVMKASLSPKGTSDTVVIRCQIFVHHKAVINALDCLRAKLIKAKFFDDGYVDD